MDIDHVPTYDEYEATRIAEKARTGTQRMKCAPAYDPSQEADPDHEWFRLHREHKDQEVHDIITLVTDVTETARLGDKELLSIHKSADALRDIALAASTEVALVGQQGMGKSLLINALTNRRDLSKTSARIGACTASAIKYRHKPGVHDQYELFDATVEFMDDTCLHEIISEHIRRYEHFHYSGNVDDDYWYEEQRAADTAGEFFQEIWNARFNPDAKKQMEELLQQTNVSNGSLLEAAMQMARQRITETGATEKRTISFEDKDIEGLMKEVDRFVSDAEDQSSLWPIVHDVIVSMGSRLARNGVVMIDLPGLGDLNQSRIAATNEMRRSASFELIVAKSERVTTEDVVDQQIRQSIRAHGARNTILVLTQIDQYFLDNHSIENEINHSKVHPYPTIKRCHIESENMIGVLDLDGRKESDEELDHIEAYQSHLTQLAQRTFVKQRACDIEKKICERFLDEDPHPIKVFSVSSSMYLDWLKVRQKQRPTLTPEMTGIPGLRRFLLGLSAEDNYKAYKEHVKVKLSMFLDKIRRISFNEKKDNAYIIIRPRYQQLVSRLRNTLENAFDEFIESGVVDIWADKVAKERRHESLLRIVHEWGEGVAWNTYTKVAREKGIVARTQAKKYVQPDKRYGSINWNEELSVDILSDMGSWKRQMIQAVVSLARDLDNYVLDACEDIFSSIMSSPLAEDLKNIAVGEWSKHQTRILAQSKLFEQALRDSVHLTYQFATTETDIRCMIARVNWETYTSVENTPRGAGRSQAQRDRMYTAMREADQKGKNLMDRISSMVRKHTKKNLRTASDTILKRLASELQLFDDHIDERRPAEYALSEDDLRLRNTLKELLPQLENRVNRLGGEFSSSVETDINVDGSAGDGVAGPSKDKDKARREDTDDAPAKKAKTSDSRKPETVSKSMHTIPKNPQDQEGVPLAPKVKLENAGNEQILWSNNVEMFGMRDDDEEEDEHNYY